MRLKRHLLCYIIDIGSYHLTVLLLFINTPVYDPLKRPGTLERHIVYLMMNIVALPSAALLQCKHTFYYYFMVP